nr:MAG TPA: hypothetical protein [Caudoviricetes sp.]
MEKLSKELRWRSTDLHRIGKERSRTVLEKP